MLFESLLQTVSQVKIETVAPQRQAVLKPLIAYIQQKVAAQQAVNLNFICTHNSRRSHLSQVWAQTAAHYFNVNNVHCYSGGTEATALFPMAAKTLERAGFSIFKISEGHNPVYAIKFAPDELPVIGFSKEFNHSFNPISAFAAVMTCSQADEGCPFIPGAEKRIAVAYDDPKAFDHTPLQAQKYQERSMQIATEMFYVFSQIKK